MSRFVRGNQWHTKAMDHHLYLLAYKFDAFALLLVFETSRKEEEGTSLGYTSLSTCVVWTLRKDREGRFSRCVWLVLQLRQKLANTYKTHGPVRALCVTINHFPLLCRAIHCIQVRIKEIKEISSLSRFFELLFFSLIRSPRNFGILNRSRMQARITVV